MLGIRQGYDDTNRLVTQSWQLGSDVYTEGFTYNSTQDGSLNTHTTATGQTLTMGYDGLRRLSTITGGVYGKTYTYRDISDTKTTTQVSSVVYDLPTDLTYGYTYDILGNIATYTDANGTVTYTYDTQGQLLSATNGSTTYSYTYDTVGNILTANGHTYTYGDSVWKDLLTAYDGQSITYDASGNPTSYYNGTRWTFSWTNGRSLATATDGTTNLSFTYDTDGLRTSKTVDGVKHSYLYAGGKLFRETYGNDTLDFFYDNAGSPYALKYNGTTYYYITNLQGDVMHLVNADGTVVASYEYDPYGNITSSSGDLAAVNPLRYRGYYYDIDSGLYYLQSRYYDPKVGRFVNADIFISTRKVGMGCNMFAYCLGNPINYVDGAGTDAIWIQEENSAKGQGHTGLMVQDEEGNWFYFFWGPTKEAEDEANIIELCIGVENGAYYVAYTEDASQFNLHSTDGVVHMVQIISEQNKLDDRSMKITKTVYLEGDFSQTHEYLNSLCGQNVNCTEQYNLILNNCIQKSLYALSLSDSRFSPVHIIEVTDGITMSYPSIHPNWEYCTIPLRLAE